MSDASYNFENGEELFQSDSSQPTVSMLLKRHPTVVPVHSLELGSRISENLRMRLSISSRLRYMDLRLYKENESSISV
ncbi:hypothetical protein Tco_0758007 [Tanacetum coccineum]